MGEPREGLRFLTETAVRRLVFQQAGGQDLDGDVAIELLVTRTVDVAMPPAPSLLRTR
jgi:hypothetical protein